MGPDPVSIDRAIVAAQYVSQQFLLILLFVYGSCKIKPAHVE